MRLVERDRHRRGTSASEWASRNAQEKSAYVDPGARPGHEMVQMGMGMMGMFIVHPRDENFRRVDRDFAFMMSSYAIDPGTALPRVSEMTDFNMWTWNNRVFPGIDPLPVRFGDRVRVRMANLTMTNHPIHLHGFRFAVTCTDGGWVPESAQWPQATVDVPVG
jgi:FtsP/CotA-like multicopper oxidase with cupredoxin domain